MNFRTNRLVHFDVKEIVRGDDDRLLSDEVIGIGSFEASSYSPSTQTIPANFNSKPIGNINFTGVFEEIEDYTEMNGRSKEISSSSVFETMSTTTLPSPE